MKKYGVNELRRMYLDFFKSKDHLVMKSFSLIPHNDNSLLLINAGMAPLKPYFTGAEIPPKRRVSQHLKEGQMTCCLSYILNITGTDTLLSGRHSSSRRDLEFLRERS